MPAISMPGAAPSAFPRVFKLDRLQETPAGCQQAATTRESVTARTNAISLLLIASHSSASETSTQRSREAIAVGRRLERFALVLSDSEENAHVEGASPRMLSSELSRSEAIAAPPRASQSVLPYVRQGLL